MVAMYSGGEAGAVGIADEFDPIAGTGTPGVFVAPTEFIMAESQGLSDDPQQIARDVYAGPGRDSDVGHRTGASIVGGPLALALYPRNALLLLYKALGKKVSISSIASDTATTFTVANGVATAVLTTGGAYNANDIVLVDTGAVQEPLPVISYTSGSKTLVLPKPQFAHASTNVAITRPAFDQAQPITASDAVGDVLGTISALRWEGDKYAEAFPGLLMESWKVTATPQKTDVAVSTMAMADSIRADGVGSNPSATAFTQGSTWGELAFEFSPDSFLVFPADPTDTGTPTVQLVEDATQYSIEIKNNLKAQSSTNRNTAMRQFPKKREVNITFDMMTPSSYPMAWKKFVKAQIDIPFFAFFALNVTPNDSPTWRAISFYCPNTRCLTAKRVDGLDATIGEAVTASARGVNSQPRMTVSVYAP